MVEETRTDRVNCPYCGQVNEVALDADEVPCSHCDYPITMGKKVLPLSNNPLAP